MDITPPYGYGPIVPLDNAHRPAFERVVPTFFRTAQVLPVSVGEFEIAGRDLPIAFTQANTPASFLPVALCSFAPGENLFVEGTRWADGVYAPAYMRRWPFCMAAVRDAQGSEQNRVACIETAVLSQDAEPIADERGQPHALWREYEPLLLEYERDLARTEQFTKILADFKLLEGFTFEGSVEGHAPVRLEGLFRVNETALKTLNADALRMLLDRGAMRLIYAHLASLDRAGLLLQRHAVRHPRQAA